MARSKPPTGISRGVLAFCVWLYALLLRAYPATFRQEYGSRMAHVFLDNCRDVLQQKSIVALIPFWLRTLSDLFLSACLEHWSVVKERTRSMTSITTMNKAPLSMWIALAATILAFAVSLVASLNLYLIEDSSSLTRLAYDASPLLRFSYDAIYVSTLAAGVAMCAIIGYTLVQRSTLVLSSLIIAALLVAFGGFGGLLVRHTTTFLVLFITFFALVIISLLVGRGVATRAMRWAGRRFAGMLGACVSMFCVLLVNVVALILHTLLLNPVSHELYMQGQIEGTHFNFSLIAMGMALITLFACVVSLGRVLHLPSRQS